MFFNLKNVYIYRICVKEFDKFMIFPAKMFRHIVLLFENNLYKKLLVNNKELN